MMDTPGFSGYSVPLLVQIQVLWMRCHSQNWGRCANMVPCGHHTCSGDLLWMWQVVPRSLWSCSASLSMGWQPCDHWPCWEVEEVSGKS